MIRISGLTLSYGRHLAVDRLDLTVEKGEALVLLGQSGCGKTSAMRCIAGLERPSAGSIVLDGSPVFDGARGVNVPPHKRNIGMVFQSYAIWPHRTVFENVAFALEMKKLPRKEIQARVHEALTLVGMDQMAERGASLLSGGQMQRVALARSVVMEPAVLLLDEPLSNLDARLRDRLRMELRQIQQRLGMTWVYVTHDQSEAFALADRVAVMETGRIVQIGPPAEIYGRPETASIAEFVGVANVLPCKLVSVNGAIAVAQLDGGSLLVRGTAPLSNQGQMRVCIRAEDIKFVPSSSSTPGKPNCWSALVSLASFQGGLVLYQVALDGGPTLNVARPRDESKPVSGDKVWVEALTDQVAIVPDRTAS